MKEREQDGGGVGDGLSSHPRSSARQLSNHSEYLTTNSTGDGKEEEQQFQE